MRGKNLMQTNDGFLICVFCGKKSIHTLPCNLCGEVLCPKEAIYIHSIEETYEGNRNKVIRICPDCKRKKYD